MPPGVIICFSFSAAYNLGELLYLQVQAFPQIKEIVQHCLLSLSLLFLFLLQKNLLFPFSLWDLFSVFQLLFILLACALKYFLPPIFYGINPAFNPDHPLL